MRFMKTASKYALWIFDKNFEMPLPLLLKLTFMKIAPFIRAIKQYNETPVTRRTQVVRRMAGDQGGGRKFITNNQINEK